MAISNPHDRYFRQTFRDVQLAADFLAHYLFAQLNLQIDTLSFSGLTIEDAWHRLAKGDVQGHNELLAEGIRMKCSQEAISSVVLAQLSMTVFLLSYPDPLEEFGLPVFTSGQCGFEHMRKILTQA